MTSGDDGKDCFDSDDGFIHRKKRLNQRTRKKRKGKERRKGREAILRQSKKKKKSWRGGRLNLCLFKIKLILSCGCCLSPMSTSLAGAPSLVVYKTS